MNKSQMHLSVSEMGVPEYRINPGGGEMFAVLDLGLIQLFIFDPAELRRLADVAANAADVLEAAQAAKAMASKCCPAEVHDVLRVTMDWYSLELVGFQSDGGDGWLTLRNCHCGATLARTTMGGEEVERLRREKTTGTGGVVMAVVP